MTYNTLSALRRTDQLYYEQISARRTLECGLAFTAREFPTSVGDNAFREVLLPEGHGMDAAWREVEDFYSTQGLVCRRWVPSAAQRPEALEPHLAAHGFVRRTITGLALTSWPQGDASTRIRVLPARAMRRAFRGLHASEEEATLAERRLDYAQFDVYVALCEDVPAGRCGLMQAGEIAEVRELFVVPHARRRGVGSALLAEALSLARRLMMRIVVSRLPHGADEALGFLEKRGFTADGVLVEFERNS
jgi:GNAT superfamily N-acetyltransferase